MENLMIVRKETFMDLVDVDLFSLIFHDDIVDNVRTSASREGLEVFQYLDSKYPDRDVESQEINVYVDNLTKNGIVI